MAKTYYDIPTFTPGEILTAANMNKIGTTVDNLTIPALVQVRRTTNLSAYSGGTAITWESTGIASTDATMWTAGDPTKVTINTTGLYHVSFIGQLNSGTAAMTLVSAGLMVNGTQVSDSFMPTISSLYAPFTVSALLNLTAGQYVQAQCNQLGGSALVIQGAATVIPTQTRMTVAWVGNTA